MDPILTFLLLSSVSAILIWIWMKNKYTYWKNNGVDSPPHEFLWGHLRTPFFHGQSNPDRSLTIYDYFKSRHMKHGGLYSFFDPVYVPIDLDIVKAIMQNDFQHFTDKIGNTVEGEVLTHHLLNLKGKKWKLMRSKLTPTFTSGKMKMMFDTLMDCTKGLERVMDEQLGSTGIDVKDILGRFTTDIIGSCAFGIECNSLEDPNNEFRVRGKSCFESAGPGGISVNLYAMLYVRLPMFIKKLFNLTLIPRDLTQFFVGIVMNTIDYREKNNVTRKDLMQLLIELKNKGKVADDDTAENRSDENKITVEEIAAQAFIFFEAGFETSSTTMTFCLYELAKNKTIQEKLRKEIKDVIREHGGRITYDAIMDMPYLDKVISETLRKYPPGTLLGRKCSKTYKVPGTDIVIEKGTRVLIPVFGIHRDPTHYPNPDLFDPERFSEENKRKRHDFSFLAFGEGPRMCIGMRFGLMQTKVGLITLLRLYDFEVSEKTQEPLRWDPKHFLLSTLGDIWLKCKKIDGLK